MNPIFVLLIAVVGGTLFAALIVVMTARTAGLDLWDEACKKVRERRKEGA